MRAIRGIAAIGIAAALVGCTPDDVPPDNAIVAASPRPSPSPTAVATLSAAESGVTRDYLVGAWSYEDNCATDFSVHFEADGSIDNSGDTGRWDIASGLVTERVTGRYEPGDEATTKVDPPLVRRYRIERIDQTHAVIRVDGRKVPILRC